MLKDKFERLANGSKSNTNEESTGQKRDSRALRKALDRRKKKNESKEKKFGGIKIGGGAMSLGGGMGEAPKRFRDSGWNANANPGGGEGSKRKRVAGDSEEKKVRKRGKRGGG